MEKEHTDGPIGPTQVPEVYRILVEKAPLPMSQVLGEKHLIQTVNEAFCRLVGKKAEELVGRPFSDLVPTGHECLTMLDEVYQTGIPGSRVKERNDVPDPVYWSYTCLPVRGEADTPLGVVVQVTETPVFNSRTVEVNQALLISAVKQHELTAEAERLNVELQEEIVGHQLTEELLRSNRDTFAALIEKAPFGLYVVDARLRLYQVSAGARKVFANAGPLLGSELGKVLGRILRKDLVEEMQVRFKHVLDTGEAYAAPVLTEQRVDTGEVESYDWRIERIILPDGRFGVVCYFYDITARKQAEQLLLESDRRKSVFLATLAHELRNPLAPLLNGLELLAGSRDDLATWDQAHGMMRRQLEQMVRLVDELLDLSRISRGTVDLQLGRVDLHAVLEHALESSRSMIDQQEHALVIDLVPGPLMVDGDGLRLVQVFINLLNNAAKYTPREGTITIRSETRRGEAIISVSDTGIGIAQADQTRVFEMFAQIQNPNMPMQGGLGIGLNIVKHLLEMHRGHIEVRSEGPGRGSEFIVSLPLSTAPASGSHTALTNRLHDGKVRRRVLVVDDNEDALNMMALLLGKWGHDVQVAHDGKEALAVGETMEPELVLMDIGMPVMDGHTACAHMRRTAWGARAFIVALTGWGQQEDVQRSMEVGFDHHLVKPIAKDALLALLDRHKGARERG